MNEPTLKRPLVLLPIAAALCVLAALWPSESPVIPSVSRFVAEMRDVFGSSRNNGADRQEAQRAQGGAAPVLPGPAQGSETAVEPRAVARCAAIVNDVERLTCFDSLARSVGVAGPKVTATIGSGLWIAHTETSAVDDSTSVFLGIQAESEINGWPAHRVTPTLWLRCREKKTEAFISTGMAANPKYGSYDEYTVTLRLDQQKAFTVQSSQATSSDGLFLPNAIALIKRMVGHERLLFSFTPFNSPHQTTTFQIGGLGEAIKPLRAACKW